MAEPKRKLLLLIHIRERDDLIPVVKSADWHTIVSCHCPSGWVRSTTASVPGATSPLARRTAVAPPGLSVGIAAVAHSSRAAPDGRALASALLLGPGLSGRPSSTGAGP